MGLTVLDAGILIGVLNANDPHHHATKVAVERLLIDSDDVVIGASTYAEILVHPFRWSARAVADVDAFLASLPARIEPVGELIAKAAARLRAHHGATLRLPDAFVVATAQELGAQAIVTTDRRWPVGLPVPVRLVE